jgi:purine-binding chemotaxis protein CheW
MSRNAEISRNEQSGKPSKATAEYLIFTLDTEIYGLDVLKVQEIRGYGVVTKIANTPEFIKGVINLRGLIVPIVDLRIKFNLGQVSYDESTIVIVLNINNRIIGMVVDGVSDVLEIEASEMKAVPDIVANIDTQYITGLATSEEQMIILVDIERLMNSHEMALVDSALLH